MTAVKRVITSFRLAGVLALLLSGLTIAATAGAASATPPPGHTIATAGNLGVPDSASGGGGPIDFWRMSLSGGDYVQFTVPPTPSSNHYYFALFAPGTTDTSFPTARPFVGQATNGDAKTVFELQAPYTGTFILAVCQGTAYCPSVENGGGVNPMNRYTFTTTFYQRVSPKVAAAETKASGTIAGTRNMGVGHFESGGANGVDFWKMSLHGGDDIQFTVPATPYPNDYYFALFTPGTTDISFPTATAITGHATNGSAKTVFDLLAPYTGTFILAVCQGTADCPSVENGGGVNPMNPYTFTTDQSGGSESGTSLRLSATSVTYGHEKSLKFSVTVSALFGGTVTGEVRVSDGEKTVCTTKLTAGKGSCTPESNSEIAPGEYSITAFYAGNKGPSRSASRTLTINK
jgi:hypothetical protein